VAKLEQAEPGTQSVWRILRSQIKSARKSLDRKTNTDRSVHTARRELRKARATLRLLRDALGNPTYRRENAALRNVARPLGEVRDGRVLLDALSSLVTHRGAPAVTLPLGRFRRTLSLRRVEAQKKILLSPQPLREARKILRQLCSRAGHWRVGRHGWSILGAGLRRTYSQGRRAFERAKARPGDERLHECRKKAKYLWHQLQILAPLGRASRAVLAAEAHELTDLLGDDHDLAVLRERATEARDVFPNAATRDALLVLIDRRRAYLQKRALQLGLRLYEKKPAAFAAGFGKDWQAWRHG
jgi:CHAD domain-containing protein